MSGLGASGLEKEKPIKETITDEELALMKKEADEVVKQFEQQQEKKMTKGKQEESAKIPQHKLLAMGKKTPQEKGSVAGGKKKK